MSAVMFIDGVSITLFDGLIAGRGPRHVVDVDRVEAVVASNV